MRRVRHFITSEFSSFPSSAWERDCAKLCFESENELFQKLKKQELQAQARSQAELGNEARRLVFLLGCEQSPLW